MSAAWRGRVVLIHALAQAVAPIHDALRAHWPDVSTADLLDSSLPCDLSQWGMDERMIGRFRSLTGYAASRDGMGASAILFTCSAFGPAIDAIRREARIPVFKPNEAAFREAALRGGRTVLLCTLGAALPPLLGEFEQMERSLGRRTGVTGILVEGALDALRDDRKEDHDDLIAAAARHADADTIVLGAFSMARAAPVIKRALPDATVLTTPDSAVRGMRDSLLKS